MKQLVVLFIVLFSISCSAFAQEFTAKLSTPEIRIGEQATIEFECSFSAAEKQIMLPALKDTISKFIEVIDVSKVDTTFDEDDITRKYFNQKITITSWDSGLHVIPPFKVILGGKELFSEPILLSVVTVELIKDQDIRDIKGIIEVPFSLWDWILSNKNIIGSLLAFILLTIVAYFLWKKYQNKPTEKVVEIVPKEKADIVAERKLKELEAKKVWQKGDVKAYHSELSYVVREYIENRFEINALEQTTDEISMLLVAHPEIDKTELAKLTQLLQLADMAKFAKQQPIAVENEQALKNAYNFIGSTKLEEKEPLKNSEKDA